MDGHTVCLCYDKETAALIVGIVNGQAELRDICWGVINDADKAANPESRLFNYAQLKAALAAGGGK